MANRMSKAAVVAVLAAGFSLAPVAHAQPRDSGVGPAIAAQGNAALALIKAEVRDAIQSWRPSAADVERKPEVVRVRHRAPDATGAGLPDSANCAP